MVATVALGFSGASSGAEPPAVVSGPASSAAPAGSNAPAPSTTAPPVGSTPPGSPVPPKGDDAGKERPVPVSFVVSGGVSLGAYEAGFLHYLVETLKMSPELFDLKIATGASAGSINGLLAMIASCDARQDDAAESLLFRTWADVGFPGLYDPKETTPIALFSRKTMKSVSERIRTRIDAGFPDTCDVVLGVSTTRLSPKREALSARSSLELPRTEEKFVVRMRGKGQGKSPVFENYVDSSYGFPQSLLPLQENPAPFDSLRDLLYASSAFPFAFDPVDLAHCMSNQKNPDAPCTPGTAVRAPFVDGGVFDNQPLGLAARLAGDGLGGTDETKARSRVAFATPFKRKNAQAPDDALFVYIDPELTSYPALPGASDAEKMQSATSLTMHYLGMFVESARSKDLVSVLEGSPELREKLVIAAADAPPVSQSLASFFGFFDKNFRVFDFYLGMRAARRFVDVRLAPKVSRLRGARVAVPHYEDRPTKNLEPYRCIRAVLDQDGSPGDTCRNVSPDLRAALQTSLARLYDRCAKAKAQGSLDPGESRACEKAMRGDEPPRVPYVPAVAAGFHRQGASESELSYVVRLLAGYGFVFRDLGLEREKAPRIERAIHEELREVLDAFRSAQPENGPVVGALGRTLLGQLTYVPASAIVHVGLGPVIEGGASFRLGAGASRFLRATVAIDAGGLSSFSGGGGAYVTLAPMAGLEAELLPLSGPAVQPRVGVRGGYLFSSVDGFLTETCTEPDKRVCSRVTAQIYGALSLFDRLRLQLAFAMLPAVRKGEDFSWSILPTGGLQFLWP